ncbi:hypothetical protein G9C98_004670, partial [Cotesia typhae]
MLFTSQRYAAQQRIVARLKLKEIAEKSSNVCIIKADLTNFKDYDRIVNEVSAQVGDAGLNVLFNNAAILLPSSKLDSVKAEDLTENYLVNTVVPIMLTKAFLPLLRKAAAAAAAAAGKQGMSVDRAAVINMTSLMGSIADNGSGGSYPYRCSKAALNAATKSMSVDLKEDGILVACMHPGWVKTDMGGSNAPMDIDSSVHNMVQTVLGLSEKDNGAFLRHDGTILP